MEDNGGGIVSLKKELVSMESFKIERCKPLYMGRGFVDSEGERRKSRSGEPKTYREGARNAEEINGRGR